jgi:hypothetical protein
MRKPKRITKKLNLIEPSPFKFNFITEGLMINEYKRLKNEMDFWKIAFNDLNYKKFNISDLWSLTKGLPDTLRYHCDYFVIGKASLRAQKILEEFNIKYFNVKNATFQNNLRKIKKLNEYEDELNLQVHHNYELKEFIEEYMNSSKDKEKDLLIKFAHRDNMIILHKEEHDAIHSNIPKSLKKETLQQGFNIN